MRWEAANVKEASRSEDVEERRPKSSETAEAALARLTKSYTAAMTCIGSMHRIASLKDADASEHIEAMQRVANAARSTLERTVLMDPLIAETHAPTWHGIVKQHAGEEAWDFVNQVRPPPASLTSHSHQSTVRELAYLSLVNYADLLLKACPTTTASTKENPGILDRGVVSHIPNLHWTSENTQVMQRLALVALCDATDLDGSDPTVWLKLACAARRLSSQDTKSYTRLERHALEQGRLALPPSVPPNRLIVQALQEQERESSLVQEYSSPPRLQTEEEASQPIILDLPRYSWSMLGRMLLRACREGSAYRSHAYLTDHHHQTNSKPFGSPCVILKLSPMLVLPPEALGSICQYLQQGEVWKFEATCRGLSAAILSARASMERREAIHDAANKTAAAAAKQPAVNPSSGTANTQQEESTSAQGGETTNQSRTATSNQQGGAVTSETTTPTRAADEQQAARSSHRTSKRVQSQLITSGKLAERKAKRTSVEFCFLAAILGCSKDDEAYQAMLKEDIDWDERVPDGLLLRSTSASSPTKPKHVRGTAGIQGRLGDASLSAFVQQWTAKNSGPADVLSEFLAHIAMNVEEVFAVDPESTMVLTSCFIECIDTLSRRSGSHQGLDPSWYGPKLTSAQGKLTECVKIFAINLLNAELRLRNCERVVFSNNDYDDDGTVVAVLVPELLRVAADIEERFPEVTELSEWLTLKARLNWLAAGFFLWWSRVSHHVSEAREMESRGLGHVKEAIDCLKMPGERPIQSVCTPHLESPGRTEQHWKMLAESSLSAFREEIQASSVVSRARELFVDKTGDIEQRQAQAGEESSVVELNDDDKASLSAIGTDLFRRYNVPYESCGMRLEELINDFLEINGNALMEDSNIDATHVGNQGHKWKQVWELIPSRLPKTDTLLIGPNPSILSILSTCMHTTAGNQLSLLCLLSRLVLAGYDHLSSLLRKMSNAALKDEALKDDDDFSDSEDSFASDDMAIDAGNDSDEMRVRLYGTAVQFFIDKILDIYQSNTAQEDLSAYVSSRECLSLVHFSLAFSSDFDRQSTNRTTALETSLDLRIFLSTQRLVQSLAASPADEEHVRKLQESFFNGLARILIGQRQFFPSILRPTREKRLGRAIRQKLCLNRAEFIGAVASEMACMLSRSRAELQSGRLHASHLVGGLDGFRINSDDSAPLFRMSRLASLCESVLWFWKYMSAHSADESRTGRITSSTVVSSFDRPIIEALYAPVASIIVGLCGSATRSESVLRDKAFEGSSDGLCLSEFYDSDSSATDWTLEMKDSDNSNESRRNKTELLRVICQAVHCIALVSCEVNSKSVATFRPPTDCDRHHGPLLPLVVSRVANPFANILLTEFVYEGNIMNKRKNLWAMEYPFGVRTIGGILDSTLHKAYRALHGFSLAGTGIQQSLAGIEQLILPVSVDDIDPSSAVAPESTRAVAQLYRCIMRAYGSGRKSPPKAALECVASALPPMEESARSKIIRKFLFSAEDKHFSHRDVIALVTRGSGQLPVIDSLPDWVWATADSPNDSRGDAPEQVDEENGDALLVRKGICHQLAQGPPPTLFASSADHLKQKEGKADERVVATKNEEELSKRFNAIVDDLCYGETVNSEGWSEASHCLLMKADLIADRLGLSKGFSRPDNFQIPNQRLSTQSRSSLPELSDEQEKEYNRNMEGWTPYLGMDLSLYVRRQWSSFPSLLACFDEVGDCGYRQTSQDSTTEREEFAPHVWREIGELYEKGDYLGWQQAWGGLFVGALRKMAIRCNYIALYLVRRRDSPDDSFLASEISQTLGMTYYSELMGSQMYGYPMHVLTDHRKRQLAGTAGLCFQFSIDALNVATGDDNSDIKQTWDLVFMKGKCHEKVASTYKEETFHDGEQNVTDGSEPTRAYERSMEQALSDYAASYKEAKIIEDGGGFADMNGGGSAHGTTEAFYRLHASRLKCLLAADGQREEEREEAEKEALRLTTAHWYVSPPDDTETGSTRERIWAVLSDIVSALAQCRIDQPFFHRSVYRHAQALMWAPVFLDPVEGMADGSLGIVPATKSYLLRGLSSNMPCANSAEAVLSPLFEKKRNQLCAVWVTNSADQSPFAELNNNVRKYDSLRGKYLSAYIDTLRLCKRKPRLEELLQWAGSSTRDLPSYFQASALNKGGPPKQPHTKESLLLRGKPVVSLTFLKNLKRQANNAIAVILEDAPLEKSQEETLKGSYACYLRLNCTVDEIRKTRSWKFGHIPEVDALCRAYLARKDHKDVHAGSSHWTGGGQKTAVLTAAIEKCQQLFPGMPNNLYGRRRRSRKSSDSSAPRAPKRKEAETSASVPFVVTVPEGLSAGDKFDTTVELEGGVKKKIRLTVPTGNPQKLQFNF